MGERIFELEEERDKLRAKMDEYDKQRDEDVMTFYPNRCNYTIS
jgi:hypothetical protein